MLEGPARVGLAAGMMVGGAGERLVLDEVAVHT